MFQRHLQNQLVSRYKTARSVYIFGPRQSGKTTLAKLSFPELAYISLEDPDVLEFVQSDPRAFFRQFEHGAIIDEPQRDANLFSYLQGQIDHENKRFVLTSSQNFLTMESISQSLAGRISILNLMPLTKAEIDRKPQQDITKIFCNRNTNTTIDSLWGYIIKGGYPEVQLVSEAVNYWFNDYIKTYIEKDVRRLINVQDLNVFQRFVKLCAGRSGSILNKASLASDAGISETTCLRWLSLLEQSSLILLLKPYYKNFNKRQIKSPKIIFIDTGLCCNLLGIHSTTHLNIHPLVGSLVETYIISELYKTFLNQGLEPNFYYWRDQHGNEIDLIIELLDGTVLPIEIKSSQTIVKKMLDPLTKWCDISGTNKGILLYGGNETQLRSNIDIIPITSAI